MHLEELYTYDQFHPFPFRYICIVFPMFHKTKLTYTHAAFMISTAWLIGPCYNAVMVGPTSKAGADGYCLYIRVLQIPLCCLYEQSF